MLLIYGAEGQCLAAIAQVLCRPFTRFTASGSFEITSQQAGQGETISSLNDARLGDLAFFADEDGRVYHVGLILSPGEIVHSSGYVHTDRLDETGIFNLITRKYTHKLFTIKRVSGLYSPVN